MSSARLMLAMSGAATDCEISRSKTRAELRRDASPPRTRSAHNRSGKSPVWHVERDQGILFQLGGIRIQLRPRRQGLYTKRGAAAPRELLPIVSRLSADT